MSRLITEKKVSFGFSSENNDNELESNIKEQVLAELKNSFRPEFLNRVDDIVVFSKLSKDDVKKIASNMLKNLAERLENLGIEITFEDEAVSAIAEAGFEKVYGARPLRRAIQSKIEDPLSEKLLDGSISKGDKVNLRYNDKFEFVKA